MLVALIFLSLMLKIGLKYIIKKSCKAFITWQKLSDFWYEIRSVCLIFVCACMLQKLPHQGIWVRMVRQMITSSTIAWTLVSHMKVHTIQAHTVLIMPYLDHEPVLYYCSISGSPSLSPNPVSPANSNLGKKNQSGQRYLQSISFIMCTYLVGSNALGKV